MTNSGRCCSAFAPIPWRCWKPFRLAKPSSGPRPREFSQSVETLQQANRRILDRLRPLYIQELGLERSIQTLLQNAKAQAPDLALTSQIDAETEQVDGLLSQTIYRVIQEAVTNVLRHARANAMHVRAAIEDRELVVEISDNGIGFPADRVFGRGLTGMLERVRALSGTLAIAARGRTHLRPLPAAGGRFRGRGNQRGLTEILPKILRRMCRLDQAGGCAVIRPDRPRRQLPGTSRPKQGRRRSAGFFRPAKR